MKTTQLFFTILFNVFAFSSHCSAQATVANATNTVTATNFLGSGSTSNFDVLFKRNNVNAGLLSLTKTNFGVNSNAMPNSVSFGLSAGQFSTGIGLNTYVGHNAGKGQSATILNTGTKNTFLGSNTGTSNTVGNQNVFIGNDSGKGNTIGNNNTYVGFWSGGENSGNYNTCIGAGAGGESSSGSGNVYIGYNVGFGMANDNKLLIDNSENFNPLIWGDFANDLVKLNGKVGIGSVTTFPTTAGAVNVSGYKLFVTGGILTEEVRVNLRGTNGLWADYVFNKDYNLKPLSEVEKFISENGHLPNVPSAQKVKEEGIELGEMAKIQQEKIEELTLYIIEQNKINEKQNKVIEDLMSRIITLEKR